MRRLALVSDIHGNLTALDAVLRELADEGIGIGACLGDVASDGPQPCEVLQRLKGARCPVVMGNADAEVLGILPVPDTPEMRMVADAAFWCAGRLEADDRAFMAKFQRRVEMTLEGWPLLFFHGSPDDFNAKLPPSVSDASLREAFAGNAAKVMAGGHTHHQMFRRIDDVTFINPGSIGLAHDARATSGLAAWADYAVLTLANGVFRAEFRRAAFDIDAHIAAIGASAMPHAESWIEAWALATRT